MFKAYSLQNSAKEKKNGSMIINHCCWWGPESDFSEIAYLLGDLPMLITWKTKGDVIQWSNTQCNIAISKVHLS